MRAQIPPLSHASSGALSPRPSAYQLMNRATIHHKAKKCNLLHDEEYGGALSVDWMYQELEAFNRGRSSSAESGISTDAILSLLKSNDSEMRLAVVGNEGVSGRLALNLGLKIKAKAIINVSADLADGEEGSSIEASVRPILSTPVSFICALPSSWTGYPSINTVFLYNGTMESHNQRKIVSLLKRSPTFRLLICLAPLPFQTELIYIGDTRIGQGKTAYVYSKNWEAVPTATISALFCVDGVCVVPPNFGELRSLPPFASV